MAIAFLEYLSIRLSVSSQAPGHEVRAVLAEDTPFHDVHSVSVLFKTWQPSLRNKINADKHPGLVLLEKTSEDFFKKQREELETMRAEKARRKDDKDKEKEKKREQEKEDKNKEQGDDNAQGKDKQKGKDEKKKKKDKKEKKEKRRRKKQAASQPANSQAVEDDEESEDHAADEESDPAAEADNDNPEAPVPLDDPFSVGDVVLLSVKKGQHRCWA